MTTYESIYILLTVFCSYYICVMCLHISRYIPLFIRVWYILCLWYMPTYDSIYILWKAILYVLYLWYVTTYESIFTSLRTYLACYISLVCTYIWADIYPFEIIFVFTLSFLCVYVRVYICLSTYVFGKFFDFRMCLQTCWWMPF